MPGPSSEKPEKKTYSISHQGKLPFPQKTDDLPEHCLNLLSPALQEKVRELEQVPFLPDWPAKTRGVPSLCLRSALFGVIKRGRRRAVKGEIVAAVKGLNIRYTGWRLDQGDFDVLVQAVTTDLR